MSIEYLDFDVLIERAGEGYDARVLASPVGEASFNFLRPFSDLELENFRLRVSRRRAAVRRADSSESEVAKTVGERLFTTVFGGEVQECLQAGLSEAGRRGAGLRLRLTGTADLDELPWEYLYSPALDRFVALSSETPVVRYVKPAQAVPPLTVAGRLRLLAVLANPTDYPLLDVDREWQNLRCAFGDLEQRGLLEMKRLADGTLSALQKELRRDTFHIVHFIGHGLFDEHAGDGMLVFEDGSGRGRPVSGRELGTLLHDQPGLRLVVLNACEGARGTRTDPSAGAAQALVRQRIPAVVAMQFEISDAAAVTFAREFYGAIADSYPVDAALAEARKAMFAEGHGVEWGTPVLYTRSADGRLFDLVHPVAEQPSPVPAGEPPVRVEFNPGPAAPPERPEAGSGPVALQPRPQPSRLPEPQRGLAIRLLRSKLAPTVLLALIFLANLGETWLETRWPLRKPEAALEIAGVMSWLEGHFTFDHHDATNVIARWGYSIAYFVLFPLLGLGVAAALARRSDRRPYWMLALALTFDYLISLPFFLFFPVPERWTYPDSGAMLLSDLVSSSLIEQFRPMSGLDNCFPSFHTSMTVVVVSVCFVYGIRLRMTIAFLGATILLATFVLGIHWMPDIVSGVAAGLISVALASRVVKLGVLSQTAPHPAAGGHLHAASARVFARSDH